MSLYYWLACKETKQRVYIGRNTQSVHEKSGACYEISIDTDEPIGPFLEAHIGKEVIPVHEGYFEDPGWQDFEDFDWPSS